MQDYPKVIRVGDVTVTVTDAADEAKWRGSAPVEDAPVETVETADDSEPPEVPHTTTKKGSKKK